MSGITSAIKAGDGDAVIFGRESRLSPADNLLQIGRANEQAKNQSKLLKQKLSNDNAQGFYKQLQDMNGKVWSNDLPHITNIIDKDIVGYANDLQKKGIDPFSDPTAMAELSGRIGKLNAFASASVGDKATLDAYHKALMEDAKKDQLFNLPNSIAKGEVWAKLPPDQRALNPLQPEYNTPNLETILDKQYTPILKQGMATFLKSTTDKNEKEVNTKNFKDFATSTELSAYGKLQPLIDQGLITPAQAQEGITKFFSKANDLTATYNANKDQDQAFAREKEATRKAEWEKEFGLKKDKFAFAKSYMEVKPNETEALFKGIAAGVPVNTMALSQQVIMRPNGEQVITGAFYPIKNKEGKVTAIQIKTYTKDENKNLVPAGDVITPLLSKDGKFIYSTSPIYQAKFADAGQNKAPATTYTTDENGDYVEVDNPEATPGTKQGTNESSSGSTTVKSYSIINPKTGQVIATGQSQEAAEKAQKKGYKIQ